MQRRDRANNQNVPASEGCNTSDALIPRHKRRAKITRRQLLRRRNGSGQITAVGHCYQLFS
ncbi:hypothetical protein MA4S0726RB_4599 [Mycobacteroides abscessus 4S-0726-RB]|nr:hypothetical protein MA4S0726RB_4599 [Mycobacteroides abscessus 4S-0726-RB]EIV07922.1 hypothetical protein MA4S0206_1835 [Mycobacteroides abscessus 4S-0206]EIV52167.1 hypothetical protein MA4S0116R_0377 [Mycobacteroides abscessus 4S-0116-R]EIV61232.1 hypothetical protein MA4S0116S_4140 [Mycobacteroides abscessus 4S-0116-S]